MNLMGPKKLTRSNILIDIFTAIISVPIVLIFLGKPLFVMTTLIQEVLSILLSLGILGATYLINKYIPKKYQLFCNILIMIVVFIVGNWIFSL